jgi:hypothetical protein
MAAILLFLREYSEEEFVASTGVNKATFHAVFMKYCGRGTPIQRP